MLEISLLGGISLTTIRPVCGMWSHLRGHTASPSGPHHLNAQMGQECNIMAWIDHHAGCDSQMINCNMHIRAAGGFSPIPCRLVQVVLVQSMRFLMSLTSMYCMAHGRERLSLLCIS